MRIGITNRAEMSSPFPRGIGGSSSCPSFVPRPRSVAFDSEDEDEGRGRGRGRTGCRFQSRFQQQPLPPAFTLIELLVVIAVAGILAAIAVPAIKEFGRSNQQVAATRQVLDAVGRARQLAIANRTTVYMVFLPNAYMLQGNFTYLPQDAKNQAIGLAPDQCRAYALVSLRSPGDQPGRNRPEYLTDWTTLPQGWIFAPDKFYGPNTSVTYTNLGPLPDRKVSGFQFSATGNGTNTLPFPSANITPGFVGLPYIAFGYNGGLLSARDDGAEIIPLARGTVDPAVDADGKLIPDRALIQISPPGNNQEVPNLIVIEGLTGRARLEERKIE